jgi:hypothetical protein
MFCHHINTYFNNGAVFIFMPYNYKAVLFLLNSYYRFCVLVVFLCVCVVLGFELRADTLSHSTSPFSRQSLKNCLPRLASNCNPPDLYLLSSYDYRRLALEGFCCCCCALF